MKSENLVSESMANAKASLEDAFFLKQDKLLIEKLHEMEKMKNTIEAYAKVTGITNAKVLDKFYQLNLPVDVVACLAGVPLIEVAWADGEVKLAEREVILKNAPKLGIGKDSIELELIERWLDRRPGEELFTAWKEYVHGLCEQLSEDEKNELKDTLLLHVLGVAEASGGFLGLIGNKVSKKQQKVIEELKSAFF